MLAFVWKGPNRFPGATTRKRHFQVIQNWNESKEHQQVINRCIFAIEWTNTKTLPEPNYFPLPSFGTLWTQKWVDICQEHTWLRISLARRAWWCVFFFVFVFCVLEEIRRSPVDMVNSKYPTILQGFIHRKWCRISEPSYSISIFSLAGKNLRCFDSGRLFFYILPWDLTWNLNMEVWKIIFLFNWVIFRFRVNFQGCRCICFLKHTFFCEHIRLLGAFFVWWKNRPKKRNVCLVVCGFSEFLDSSPRFVLSWSPKNSMTY